MRQSDKKMLVFEYEFSFRVAVTTVQESDRRYTMKQANDEVRTYLY